MTTTIDPGLSLPVNGSPDKYKSAIAAAVGGCVENYDYIAYGTASALYLGSAFFPETAPAVGTLLSFATLAVGYVLRPLGGALGGHFADKYGRRPVLIAALLVMGIATFLIGCLPTYAVAGVTAPIILVVIRMIQGLAFGAEWGSGVTMAYEHAPLRRRGFFASIPQSGNYLGIGLASTVFVVSAGLPGDWKWRLPFLASVILIALGIWIRLRLNESPVFTAAKQVKRVERNPFWLALRRDWSSMLRVIGLRIMEAWIYYLTATYLLNYIATNHPDARPVALIALTVSAFFGVATALLGGYCSDRFGRKWVVMVAGVLAILFAFPMFLLTNDGTPALIVLVYIIGITVIDATLSGSQAALLVEQFPAETRVSGASFGNQVASALSGFAPLIAALLVSAFGWPGAAGLYILVALIGLVTALTVKETWGKKQKAELEAMIAAAPDASTTATAR